MEDKLKYCLILTLVLMLSLTAVLTGCENALLPAPPAATTRITAASPDSASREQQETVTISGTNFNEVTRLSFGKGVTVKDFSIDSDNQITATITISNDAETGTRDVSVITPTQAALLYQGFMVKDAPPRMEISSAAVDLEMKQGESSLPVGKLTVRNSGGGTLNWSIASEKPWLEVSPASGSSSAQPQEVTVSLKLNAGMLAYAPYSTTIRISALGAINSPQDIPVTFRITENPRYIYRETGTLNGADGKPIELVDNPRATNPTYAELMKFIAGETTDRLPFVSRKDADSEPFGYADFAEAVHNNAESAGIRAAVVGIEVEGDSEIYFINAVETADKGMVFIDCIGESGFSQLDEMTPRKPMMSWDKVAYVVQGKRYGTVPADKASSPEYSFYEEYAQKWQKYKDSLKAYNLELEQFNKDSYRLSLMTTPEHKEYDARYHRLKEMEKTLDVLREEFGENEFKPLGVVKSFTVYWNGGRQK